MTIANPQSATTTTLLFSITKLSGLIIKSTSSSPSPTKLITETFFVNELITNPGCLIKKVFLKDKIRSFIDNQDINQYMSFIVDRLFAANKYFNDQEPWKKKDDRLRLNTIVYTALELIRKITILLYPVMPETSVKVLNVFNETENSIDFTSIDNNEILKKDLKINKLDILFKKIEK